MLYSEYRVLPFPVNCDTLLLCYNPYFDVQFKQCYALDDLLSLLGKAPPTHKVVLFADSFDAGQDLITQVNRLKEEGKNRAEQQYAVEREEESDAINDRLSQLAKQLVQPPPQKSSFLHLKCLLNKTEIKISNLASEIKAREGHQQRTAKVGKKAQKQQKIQRKQLQQLEMTRQNIRQQIITHEQTNWWKEQCKKSPFSEPVQEVQLSSCEALLSDSQQKKEERKENWVLL